MHAERPYTVLPCAARLRWGGVAAGPSWACAHPPNPGIQNEWITSADVIATRTGLPDGTCSSLAVVRPRSRYLNSHHHWWPITSTLRASAGASPAVAKMVRTVGTATKTRITAGARVQAISMSVWPCVGFGAGRPSPWRNRTSATTSISSTTTNTAAAHQKMSVKSTSVARAKSERGWSVDWGNGPPHPESASAAVTSQSRIRGTATRVLRWQLRSWDTSTAEGGRQRTRALTSNSASSPPTELPPTYTRNFPGSTTNFMSLL